MSRQYTKDFYQNLVRVLPEAVNLNIGDILDVAYVSRTGFIYTNIISAQQIDVWAWGSEGLGGALIRANLDLQTSFDLFMSSDDEADVGVDVTVDFIDTQGAPKKILAPLNGQTGVDLGEQGVDVNEAFILDTVEPQGNVYITMDGDFTGGIPDDPESVLAYMPQSYNKTQQCLVTVPKDYIAVMDRVELYVNAGVEEGPAGMDVMISAASAQVDLVLQPFLNVPLTERTWPVTKHC